MNVPAQIAKHFHDVHYGGNWTSVNLKDTLTGVTLQQATTKVHSCNTIATLVFHINYYVRAVSGVLLGEPLTARDKYSFDLPTLQSEEDWKTLLHQFWTDADAFIRLVEALPEEKLSATFAEEKYGTYYRNLHGLIEHTHYHLGQMVLIKKLLSENSEV